MALLGAQNVCLDSSVLSSCSSLRPSSNLQRNAVRFARPVQCSCSRQDESSETTSTSRLSGLSRLAATGMMALAISTTSASGIAMAQQDQSLIPVFNVGEQADKLLKDADKLTNDDSPPRFGPSRGGIDQDDSGRIAQKGGSGPIPEIQGPGSDLVGQAKDKVSEKASATKDRLDDSIGKAQNKAGDVKKTIDGFFGKAKSKVGGDVDATKGKVGSNIDAAKGKVSSDIDAAKDSSGDLKGFVGDARNKAQNAGDNANNVVGSIKKGLRIQ